MLSPIYRRAGIELTRIRPYCDQLARIEVDKRYAARLAHQVPTRVLKKRAKRLEILRRAGVDEKALIDVLAWLYALDDQQITRCLNHANKAFGALPINDRGDWTPPSYRELFWSRGTDPECMEFASAPMASWNDFREFFTQSDHFLNAEGCLRHSDYIAGTGGHIHLETTLKESYKTRRMLLNHPWAVYAFADPRSEKIGIENVPRAAMRHAAIYRSFREGLRMTEGGDDVIGCLDGSSEGGALDLQLVGKYHRHAIATRADKARPTAARMDVGQAHWKPSSRMTTEWRLFDIAQTWAMQEEHMAFAQRFTEYAAIHDTIRKVMTTEDVSALSPEDMVAGFRRLIETLELPWRRYQWYAKHNIRTRMELGIHRDVMDCARAWAASV